MPVYNSTKFKSLPQQVLENQKKIKVLEDNETSVDDKIDKNQKGQPLGVAELDVTGKVPASQLPTNPGNFLPLAGGTMEGDIQLDGNTIGGASVVQTYLTVTEELGSSLGDLKVLNPIKMNQHKIKDTLKGTSVDDVATIDNINDHNASPFAHADLRAKVDALNGTYIILGKIDSPTSGVNEINLNARVFELKARLPMLGDVLIDNDNNEHYFNGTNWDNIGQFIIELATASNDGLLAKEDFVKIQNQYDKAYIDSTFGTVNTQLYNDQVRMMDIELNSDEIENKFDGITDDLKEDITDLDIDLTDHIDSEVLRIENETDLKIKDIGLDTPIVALENNTLREVFEGGNLLVNGDFSNGTANWANFNSTFTVSNGIATITDDGSAVGRIQQTLSIPINTELYVNIRLKSSVNNTNLRVRFQPNVQDNNYTNVLNIYSNKSSLFTITNNQTSFYISNLSASSLLDIDYIYMISRNTPGISHLTVKQMDYWFKVYEEIKEKSTTGYVLDALNERALGKQEAWLTPTITNGVGTYFKYRKNNFGTIEFSGQITASSLLLNPSFTLPVGYRPSNVPYVIQLTQNAIMGGELDPIYTSVTLVILTSGLATIYTTKTVDSIQTYVYTYGKFETE